MKKFMIGCGVVVVVVLIAGTIGVYRFAQWAQDKMPDVERVAEQRRELIAAHGDLMDYVPPVDGTYDASRVERFVDVRETIVAEGTTLAAEADAIIERMAGGGPSGLRGFVKEMAGAFGLVGRTISFTSYADSVLLANEMGRGEYGHYQLILLHGWYDLDEARQDWNRQLERGQRDDEAVQSAREVFQAFERQTRDVLSAHLQNLRDAVATAGDDSSRAYLARMEAAAAGLPFVDPAPASLRASFDANASALRASVPRTIGAWLAETPPLLETEELDDARRREISVEF